ncbi:MAG: glycosyltransferase [Actinomycetota bacterium]|nr:glycosyltransferase [Actinomycetota bacterium]
MERKLSKFSGFLILLIGVFTIAVWLPIATTYGSPVLEVKGKGAVIKVFERYIHGQKGYKVKRYGYGGKKIVLTFEDGPDPLYTPKILRILKRHDVKATFFVVGQKVLVHPELVRKEFDEGHEIGNHTFSHVHLAKTSRLQAHLELTLTQRLLQAITRKSFVLFRPPEVFFAGDKINYEGLKAIKIAQDFGYISVLYGIDPQDWKRPGVEQMLKSCLSEVERGSVILLHDGGRDCSQTVEALPKIITSLKGKGFEFVTLSELLLLNRAEVLRPASRAEQFMGYTVLGTYRAWLWAKKFFVVIFILAILLTFIRTILVALFALFQKVYIGRRIPAVLNHNPRVSILVPAYNEEKVIGNCINWLLQTTYPNYEIIVVDDGSTDGTADEVLKFAHYPEVKLIRKPNGGKASALNEGIRNSDGEILVMMDADTKFEPNTVGELVRHFKDPKIGAVSGNIKVGNRNTILTLWQSMEYIMSCNLDRRMMSILNCITVVPGPVGAFRREAIEEAGYFSSETLAEDTDMTMSIRKLGYKICYEDHAVAWTEAPNDLSGLWKQRYHWSYGTPKYTLP